MPNIGRVVGFPCLLVNKDLLIAFLGALGGLEDKALTVLIRLIQSNLTARFSIVVVWASKFSTISSHIRPNFKTWTLYQTASYFVFLSVINCKLTPESSNVSFCLFICNKLQIDARIFQCFFSPKLVQ